jgi:MacB-like protein
MPDFREYVRRNLPPLGLAGAREAEIVEELALEFEERYQRELRGGLTPEQAWRETQKDAPVWHELGQELRMALSEPQAEPLEPPRRENMFARVGYELWRDLGYATRQLRKSPGFTTVAVLMLALGIGANTAIFSLLNAVLLRNLPVREPAQLVFFGETEASGDTEFLPHGSTQVFSYPFFHEFLRKNRVFVDVAAIQSFLTPVYGRAAGRSGPEKVKLELVSGTYFRTLGVNAIVGRAFTEADERTPGAHPVAVARYSWWRDRFANDASPAQKTIAIGSTVYTIIGVAPPEFSGVSVGQTPDLWIPLAMQKEISPDRNGLDNNWFQCLHMIARLKPAVSQPRAQASTNLLFRQILRGYLGPKPTADELNDVQRAHIELTPAATGRSELRREFSSPLEVLMAVVVLVLLIACANVANLRLTVTSY